MATTIHPTALVEKGAELGDDVLIGPFCSIGPRVKIGRGSRLQSHVVVEGNTVIGEDNHFHPFCVIGGPPQDLSYKDEDTRVLIGDRNKFRESVTVNRGTFKDKKITTIGNDNFLMAYCHVAHDCVLGHSIVMANQVALAGHVTLGNFVIIGGLAAVTQHVRIGDCAFIGAGAILRKDLPPYMSAKDFSDVTGPNLVGLKRRGFSDEDIRVVIDIYKTLYMSNLTTEKALTEIETNFAVNPRARVFIDFARGSKIGLQR